MTFRKGEFKPHTFKCKMCGCKEELIHRRPNNNRMFCEECKRVRNSTKMRDKYKKGGDINTMKKASAKSNKPAVKKAGPAKKGGKY